MRATSDEPLDWSGPMSERPPLQAQDSLHRGFPRSKRCAGAEMLLVTSIDKHVASSYRTIDTTTVGSAYLRELRQEERVGHVQFAG